MHDSTPDAAGFPQCESAAAPLEARPSTLEAQTGAASPPFTVMSVDRALVVAQTCRDDHDYVSAEDARGAAVALFKAVEEADGQLRRMHAALQRLDDGRPRHAGEMLQLRKDANGWRHLLDGEAVHAGDALLLLTATGWLPIRYEWRFDPTVQPTAALALPCAWGASEAVIRLPDDARLAWPVRRR